MNATRDALLAAIEASDCFEHLTRQQAEEINRLLALNEYLQRRDRNVRTLEKKYLEAVGNIQAIRHAIDITLEKNLDVMKQIAAIVNPTETGTNEMNEVLTPRMEPENQASMPARTVPGAKPNPFRAKATDPLRDGERLAHPATFPGPIDPTRDLG